MNTRAIAAKCLFKVLTEQKQFNSKENNLINSLIKKEDKNLAVSLCYGVLGAYIKLRLILKELAKKNIKKENAIVEIILLIGIYEIIRGSKEHACVNENVTAIDFLGKKHHKGFVNAVLRNFIRNKAEVLKNVERSEEGLYAHDSYFINELKNFYPKKYKDILIENNTKPKVALRVNTKNISFENYLKKLQNKGFLYSIHNIAPNAILIEQDTSIESIPGYKENLFFIQDVASQLASIILEPKEKDTILDACAAPGGKTTHIAQLQPKVKELIAVEKSTGRCKKLIENVEKLGLNIKIVNEDILNISDSFNNCYFDKILLDAPCTATGIIRRHPEIKLLRSKEQIKSAIKLQANILNSLWPLLKPRGTLLYVVCSVLPSEGCLQIEKFIKNNADCILKDIEINTPNYSTNGIGLQLLPGLINSDGFFFAKLEKLAT